MTEKQKIDAVASELLDVVTGRETNEQLMKMCQAACQGRVEKVERVFNTVRNMMMLWAFANQG